MIKQTWLMGVAVVLLAACGLDTRVGDLRDGGTGGGAGGGTGGGSIVVDPPKKRVFVTSGSYSGNFKTLGNGSNGLDGADKLCNTVAQGAGISGVFKAWLSGTDVDAIDRINDVGPWYQLKADGTYLKTFNNRANLVGTALEGIRYDENGAYRSNRCVWTGTNTGGRRSATCGGFISDESFLYGNTGRTEDDDQWTSATGCDTSCDNEYALYCFEQ